MIRFVLPCCAVLALISVGVEAAGARRSLTVDDVYAVREISEPQISPDGRWIAYTLRSADAGKDEFATHVWMASWDGEHSVQLTWSDDSEHSPRWSPDDRYLSFISGRGQEDGPAQVWLLDRRGGDAQPLTSFKGDVLDYQWSPDGRRLALIVADADPQREAKKDEDKTAPPIVVDRFYFKEDESGYLGALRQHLYVFDLKTRTAEALTPGRFDEYAPSWAPDGKQIAFVSKRGDDPDRNNEFGLYVIEPRAGAPVKLLTRFQGDPWSVAHPQWRPDGREIAIVAAGDPKLIYYAVHRLVIVPASGGEPRVVSAALDRNVIAPQWSADGRALFFLIESERNQHLARLDLGSGKVERLMDGRRETLDFDVGARDRIALVDGDVSSPPVLYAREGRNVRAVGEHNEWVEQVQLAATEEIQFASKDGTVVQGFLVKPPGYLAGRRYPTVLWIHGGPVSQFANAFNVNWQIFAANGYAVIGVNPRGSSGRGEAFSSAIYAEWGGKDSEDVLAAVDHAVGLGVADPDRLVVGGWSYGGILTNVVIAKNGRFKAATSGASIANVLAGYGTDMYVREYEMELGTPWDNLEVYLRNSYPFLHADRIKTPTLFLCGERDFNVPLLNSEQMYQALRSNGVDTQLVIYPEQFHGLSKPSYLKDRMQRYLDWYGKHLGERRTADGGQ